MAWMGSGTNMRQPLRHGTMCNVTQDILLSQVSGPPSLLIVTPCPDRCDHLQDVKFQLCGLSPFQHVAGYAATQLSSDEYLS